MSTTEHTDFHALTLAEINRQVRAFGDKRRRAVAELISLEKAREGGHPAAKPLDDHGKAVRERAITMLNGHAASVLKFAPVMARENELRVEIDAIDVVTAALQKSETAARAAEAAKWTEEHKAEWITLVREFMLSAIRTQALAEKVNNFIDSAPDRGWGCDLPFLNSMPQGALSIFSQWDSPGDALREPRTAALAQKILTSSDIRKASNV